jgi:fructosamine-3-kinase
LSELIPEISKHSGIKLESSEPSLNLASDGVLKAKAYSEKTSFFIKVTQNNNFNRLTTEARGLKSIAETNTIRTPSIIACGETKQCAYIILEYLELQPKTNLSASILGSKLAEAHKNTQELFGLNENNWIGLTRQHNQQHNNWPTFYLEQRLKPQLELAYLNGYKNTLKIKADHLIKGNDLFFKDYSPTPSLLHGDLWAGNWGTLNENEPVIFDPAVYYGDRETDIAMTLLFGGFPGGFYKSYNKAWPLSEGFKNRQDLYNLYHVINHLNIFGQGYLSQAENLLDKLVQKL